MGYYIKKKKIFLLYNYTYIRDFYLKGKREEKKNVFLTFLNYFLLFILFFSC